MCDTIKLPFVVVGRWGRAEEWCVTCGSTVPRGQRVALGDLSEFVSMRFSIVLLIENVFDFCENS